MKPTNPVGPTSTSTFRLPWSLATLPPTPFYFYDQSQLARLHDAFLAAMTHHRADVKLHLAVKANNNPAVLKFFKARGAGADIVSGGELTLALKSGFKANDMIFSGVGKTLPELELAVRKKIFLINIESAFELEQLERLCKKLKSKAQIAFRVNPDVDAKTHPYIATGLYEHKFGLGFAEAFELYLYAARSKHLTVRGISMHIGSQLLDLRPLDEAVEKVIELARALKAKNIDLDIMDVGGGLGVSYDDPFALPPFDDYARILGRATHDWKTLQGESASLHCECGRALLANAGWLVTRVIGVKQNPRKTFVVADASMSELMRPSLYGARHPVYKFVGPQKLRIDDKKESRSFELVGPVCESSDVLHPAAQLPQNVGAGDVLALACAGAYGYTMANFYNVRALPAEYVGQEGQAVVLSRARRPF